MIAARDEAVIAVQLGRPPRGLLAVAHRCPCGLPDVAQTAPRLPDGSPFPTLYYLTCPRAAAAVSKLEAAGIMRDMTARLADDELRHRYQSAHRDYLARREIAERVPTAFAARVLEIERLAAILALEQLHGASDVAT